MDTSTVSMSLDQILSGAQAAVHASNYLMLAGYITAAVVFVLDWIDVLKFVPAGTAKKVAVGAIAVLIAFSAASVLPGSSVTVIVAASVSAGVSAFLRQPEIIAKRFDKVE